MKITLNWINRNVGEDGTRIYRSLTPINALSLPAPLVTLAPGVLTYTDDNAVQNATYYYRTEIFKGADKVLNPRDIVVQARSFSGPGPQALVSGTSEIGLYGEATAAELVSYTALREMCGMTAIGSVNSTLDRWLKFSYKGKILFVAKQGLNYDLTWKQLYNLGLVYGVDGPGVDLPSGITPVSQTKTIVLNGAEYRVRLLKGLPTASGVVSKHTNGIDVVQDLTGSEWNDLFYRLSSRTDLRFAPTNRFKSVDTALAYHGGAVRSATYCQERAGDASATTIISRGASDGNALGLPLYMGFASGIQVVTATGAPSQGIGPYSIALMPTWRPVLELIG